jgi:hypothetical protein
MHQAYVPVKIKISVIPLVSKALGKILSTQMRERPIFTDGRCVWTATSWTLRHIRNFNLGVNAFQRRRDIRIVNQAHNSELHHKLL